jgi:hypothetical protein
MGQKKTKEQQQQRPVATRSVQMNLYTPYSHHELVDICERIEKLLVVPHTTDAANDEDECPLCTKMRKIRQRGAHIHYTNGGTPSSDDSCDTPVCALVQWSPGLSAFTHTLANSRFNHFYVKSDQMHPLVVKSTPTTTTGTKKQAIPPDFVFTHHTMHILCLQRDTLPDFIQKLEWLVPESRLTPDAYSLVSPVDAPPINSLYVIVCDERPENEMVGEYDTAAHPRRLLLLRALILTLVPECSDTISLLQRHYVASLDTVFMSCVLRCRDVMRVHSVGCGLPPACTSDERCARQAQKATQLLKTVNLNELIV